ncbi:bacterio-opsin activator domain-containing protein [Haloarcula rara]|uniref:bacterio-opsin activator domain-containing protein n=1 Tax=Haloarcula rara TaxID=3033387 RepID=UPI0023E7BF48|nr:bacterio-opsin activator domain-containing protein [Halomicroarcula sp. SHR3]
MATESTTAATATRVLYAGAVPSVGPGPEDIEKRRENLTVVQQAGFDDALDHVERGAVACVVASHTGEGGDGLTFLEALRRERPELPVVLVTATDDVGVARRAVAADVAAFVPAADEDALDAVLTAVDEHAAPAAGSGRPVSDLSTADERRLKERVLDEAPIGITISDATQPDRPIVYANGAFEAITGYPPTDVMGANHRFLQGPETDPETVADVAADIEAENETRFVIRNYRRDGTPFWNQVEVTPIRDGSGDVTHYVGFQMDVTERERAKRELEAERVALDQLLDRIEGLANDVTESLVRASDRDEIERLVTERFGGGDEYATAWLGRYDAADRELSLTEWAGRERVGKPPISLDGDGPTGRQRLLETIERGEVLAVEDTTGLPAPETDGTCLLLPLTYRSVTYGVLAVFADDRVTGRERVLLGALARSIGTSINDVLTKQSMATDSVRTVRVGLYDELFLTDIARELDCQFEHEILVESADDGEIRELVSTDQEDADAVVSAAEAHRDVLAAEPLVTGDEGSVVELRLDDWPLVDLLSEFGARLGSLSADGQRTHVEFSAGTENSARRAIDALRERYDTVELLAYHEDQPRETVQGFRESVRDYLTERQLTALKKAYVGGFFEWPRAVEGQQLASSMDVVPSTFHQHLQAAERKVFAALFEG